MYEFLAVLLLHLLRISVAKIDGNNVCRTFWDYLHVANNRNCYYNPDVDLTTPDLIRKYAGVVESYKVTTEDGYILTMFRIPRKNPKEVILLHHPLGTNSRAYVMQGNDSTAMLLWKAGYDVWISNQRGCQLSQEHVRLSSADYQFWDYSFHEVGYYDVPAEIKLIRSKTGNSKIVYFGHSMGTTVGLVYATTRPDEAREYVKTFALASTSCFYKYTNDLSKLLSRTEPLLKALAETFRVGAVLPLFPMLVPMGRFLFRIFPLLVVVVQIFILVIGGWTPEEPDPILYNLDQIVNIENISSKLGLHFLQLTNAETDFRMFDYGPEKNVRIYGRNTPLSYPIQNISVPIFLISSTDDSLTNSRDSELLYERLPERAKIYGRLVFSGLNHFDFHFGIHRKELFVANLIKFLDRLEGTALKSARWERTGRPAREKMGRGLAATVFGAPRVYHSTFPKLSGPGHKPECFDDKKKGE